MPVYRMRFPVRLTPVYVRRSRFPISRRAGKRVLRGNRIQGSAHVANSVFPWGGTTDLALQLSPGTDITINFDGVPTARPRLTITQHPNKFFLFRSADPRYERKQGRGE